MSLRAPFPWFGGKSSIADAIWSRLGEPRQYVEPFCGSAAVLLAAPKVASLEVIGDVNGFVANFWRCVKHQPEAVAQWADYPVVHIDLHARHRWLLEQQQRLAESLWDPDWPGDPKVAGWWLYGQCAWIGSGWCEWTAKIPHVSDAGMGVQATAKIPFVGNAGKGVQSTAQISFVGSAGRGVITSAGATALEWLGALAARLDRVRVIHGEWTRCLNLNHGGASAAVLLDPPYRAYESLYGDRRPTADACADWARDNPGVRVIICGHVGDYDLPGWEEVVWKRPSLTYGGASTTNRECLWASPACARGRVQVAMFGGAA